MVYKLFLDDLRDVPMVYTNLTNEDFVIVRNYKEFVEVITEKGLPDFVSFDNDLGEDSKGNLLKDGYDCVKWLVYESGLGLKKLNFNVHSANPIASIQINSLLNNYIEFIKKRSNA